MQFPSHFAGRRTTRHAQELSAKDIVSGRARFGESSVKESSRKRRRSRVRYDCARGSGDVRSERRVDFRLSRTRWLKAAPRRDRRLCLPQMQDFPHASAGFAVSECSLYRAQVHALPHAIRRSGDCVLEPRPLSQAKPVVESVVVWPRDARRPRSTGLRKVKRTPHAGVAAAHRVGFESISQR